MQKGLIFTGENNLTAWVRKLPMWIGLSLVVLYFINCFTPLRLTYDTIRYFKIKEWMEAGSPPGGKAAKDILPYGYVYLLIILGKIGLAKSLVISVVHLLYLLGTLWFVKRIFPELRFWTILVVVMFSWAILKFVVTPLSEMQFIFFSVGALQFYRQFETTRKIHFLFWSIVFSVIATVTRSAGFVLILSMIGPFFLRTNFFISGKPADKKRWIGILGIAISILIISKYIFANQYLTFFGFFFKNHDLKFYLNNFYLHLIDWSSIMLNAPSRKINFIFPPHTRDMLYAMAGIPFLLVYAILLLRQKDLPLVIRLYTLAYILLIFFWPFYEPRFWVPVFPLLVAILLRQELNNKFFRLLRNCYLGVFMIVGIAGLSYYTYISFHKEVLSVKQDEARWRSEYENYFFGRSSSADTTVVNILKKYN